MKLVNEWFLANKLSLKCKKNNNNNKKKTHQIYNWKSYQISRRYHRWKLNMWKLYWSHRKQNFEKYWKSLRASHSLDFRNLKIYFSFIHIYINYANIALASSFKTNLQEILKKQKHAGRIIFHANRFDHLRPLSKEMKALNFFQIT